MQDNAIHRKLTAVFYADIAGYSRLMRQNEVGTHQQVMSTLDHASETITSAGGTVLRYAGDAVLAEFLSIVAAIETAVSIQQELSKRNSDKAEDDKIQIRIGINLGEVMQDRGEIFGDGVNLTARLEAAAEPGGLCISSFVHDQIADKVDIEFVDGGEELFKNIDKPVRVYRWHPRSVDSTATVTVAKPKLTSGNRKPTLLLSRGKALGSSQESALLLEGTLDTISGTFANLSGIKLVTSAEDADYQSTLNVQFMAKRFRLTVTLHDLKAGEQFWSEKFEGNGEDLFEALDDLASRLTTSIRFEVYEREGMRLKSLPLDSKTNEELLSEAGPHLYRPYIEDYKRAELLLDRVIENGDTGFTTFAMRAIAAMREANCGFRAITQKDGNLAAACIARAIEDNSRSEFVQHVHAIVQIYWFRDIDAALRASRISLDLNPSMTITFNSRALALLFSGDAQSAIDLSSQAIEKYPRYMGNYWLYSVLALAEFTLGRADDAISWAQSADSIYPNALLPLLFTVAAYQTLGDQHRVDAIRLKILTNYPEFRLVDMAALPFRITAQWDSFYNALLASGLPE